MLIQKRFWAPIRSGEVTLTFRRWKRPQVLPGRDYRTAAGRLHVEAVEVVDRGPSPTTRPAAGHADATTLLADLPGDPGQPLYRIRFRYLDEPDPRSVLAADDDLSPDDVAAIAARLARLDRASNHGPWTTAYLEAIEAHPHRRAPDLAATFGRETQPFKTDVRKLKNLGLTISHCVGYELSPRGRAFLAARRAARGG